MNYINLDFCIINNPLGKNKKPIIFVTRKGMKCLDETIINEDDYEKAITIIQDTGYIETDILTFEFSQDPGFPNIEICDIKEMLERGGMRYSQEFEKAMENEFQSLKPEEAKQFIKKLSEETYFQNNNNKFNEIYKIPEIGEKTALYFYLFIECKFSGDKCYLNLNGDFASKESNELRNFILPFKCNFIRINNIYNPNKIILKSCQTNKEILKKLPMHFSGSFNLKIKEKNKLIDKLFVYYLMEVKNSFPKDNRITIEIDSPYNFDQMIEMSKTIKKDYNLTNKLQCNLFEFEEIFNKIKEVLTPKMLDFASEDEYEKASKIKKDIKYIDNKIERLNFLKNKLQTHSVSYSDFIMNFHVN